MGGWGNLTGAWKSRAALALLGFIVLNGVFQAACAISHFDRFEATNHRWTWWAVKGYKELAAAPDCVLMGSSLVQRLVNEGESTYLRYPINGLTHNKCIHLQDNIKRQTGIPLSTYAFAIGGMHASDATVIAEGLFRDKAPKTIIYAIAPRDFMDNMMLSPSDTEIFALMSHISDLGELGLHARTSTNERVNYSITSTLTKVISLAEYKSDLITIMGRNCRAALFPILNQTIASVEHPLAPGEIGIKSAPFDFSGYASIPPEQRGALQLSENFLCYHCCYQPFRPKPYNTQIYFLRHLLQFANQHEIHVILVNMPLRQDNLKAMTPHFYELYRNDIAKIASQYGAEYVDMFDPKEFKFDDFTDTVHLSGFGAIKLVDKLSDKIAKNLAVVQVKNHQSKQVAETGSMQ